MSCSHDAQSSPLTIMAASGRTAPSGGDREVLRALEQKTKTYPAYHSIAPRTPPTVPHLGQSLLRAHRTTRPALRPVRNKTAAPEQPERAAGTNKPHRRSRAPPKPDTAMPTDEIPAPTPTPTVPHRQLSPRCEHAHDIPPHHRPVRWNPPTKAARTRSLRSGSLRKLERRHHHRHHHHHHDIDDPPHPRIPPPSPCATSAPAARASVPKSTPRRGPARRRGRRDRDRPLLPLLLLLLLARSDADCCVGRVWSACSIACWRPPVPVVLLVILVVLGRSRNRRADEMGFARLVCGGSPGEMGRWMGDSLPGWGKEMPGRPTGGKWESMAGPSCVLALPTRCFAWLESSGLRALRAAREVLMGERFTRIGTLLLLYALVLYEYIELDAAVSTSVLVERARLGAQPCLVACLRPRSARDALAFYRAAPLACQ